MSQFEYVMVLLSIVLGLGITHLLVGIGGLVYRISGQGAPVRLYWGHLLWVAFVFTYLIGFWWWEFSWAGTETWGLLLYVFLVLYATSLFLLCVVLFPWRADDVTDFGSYFLAVRCLASCHMALAQPNMRLLAQACFARGSAVLPDGTSLSFSWCPARGRR